jgi:hypothetical protein
LDVFSGLDVETKVLNAGLMTQRQFALTALHR